MRKMSPIPKFDPLLTTFFWGTGTVGLDLHHQAQLLAAGKVCGRTRGHTLGFPTEVYQIYKKEMETNSF